MKKEIDISKCIIEFNDDSDITIKDVLVDMFVEFTNKKLGYIAITKKYS